MKRVACKVCGAHILGDAPVCSVCGAKRPDVARMELILLTAMIFVALILTCFLDWLIFYKK